MSTKTEPRELNEAWLDWRLNWTSVASQRATLEGIANRIMERAAVAYRQDRDQEANTLRELAREFQKDEKIARAKLQTFIDAKEEPPMWEGESV